MKLEDLQRVHRGLYRIDFKEFDSVLYRSIRASKDYSTMVWRQFQADQIGYIATREPAIQGRMLLELAWEKGEAL